MIILKKEGLSDVELDSDAGSTSYFFIDNISKPSLAATYAIFFVFISMHIFASIRAPNVIGKKDELFLLNKTEENVSMDVDITLSKLSVQHKFIDVNGSIIRKSKGEVKVQEVDISKRVLYLKNYELVQSEGLSSNLLSLHYLPENNLSSSFHVHDTKITDFDCLQIKMTFKTDFKDIKGFLFHWTYSNPSAQKYSRAARFLMSFLIGYMLVMFSLYLTIDSDRFTQVFCLVLGVAGISASNPLSLIMPKEYILVTDAIFIAVFNAIFRMFLISQFEIYRSQKNTPMKLFTIISGVLFLLYAIVEAMAIYDRSKLLENAKEEIFITLFTEKVLAIVHVVFIVFSFIYLIITIINNKESYTKRLWFITCCLILSNIVTGVTGIVFAFSGFFMFSVMPIMLVCAVNITCGAFCMFFHHPGGGSEYEQIEGGAGVADPMVLSMDHGSDDLEPVIKARSEV